MLVETLAVARDVGRLNEIAVVLIRHGFGDLVRRLGLLDGLARAGRIVRLDLATDPARAEPPVRVRQALEALGPTFVKLGQILAGRTDLLGPEWTSAFEKLHSHVPSVPFHALAPQLREDLGAAPEDVFARFDTTPLAAASIAQVHAAQLADGTEVVVKIRRPGIVELVEADLRLLGRLAAAAQSRIEWLRAFRPKLLVDEFARSLRRELDLSTECRHAERIAAHMTALPYVVIPRLHWAFTGPRVNVQDRMQGVPGDELGALTPDAGFDRTLLAQRGAQAFLKMILQDGLFHADPHPGNVSYFEGNRIGLIDFGMVGRLSERRRDELLALVLGLVERRPQDVAEVLLDWTGDGQTVDVGELESEVEAFIDQYYGTPLAELNLGQMLGDVMSLLREHRLSLPAELSLVIKAFISLEGMGRGLDPAFHMAGEALPVLRQIAREHYRPRAMAMRGWRTLRRALAVVEQLPHDASRLLRSARRGRLNVGIEVAHLKRVGNQVDRAANRLAMALVIAALIVGSSIVMTVRGGPSIFGLPAFGFLGFCGAVAGGVWLVRAIWRSGHDDEVD